MTKRGSVRHCITNQEDILIGPEKDASNFNFFSHTPRAEFDSRVPETILLYEARKRGGECYTSEYERSA